MTPEGKGKKVNLTKELTEEIISGLGSGTFEQYADEPAKGDESFQEMVDEIATLVNEHGARAVLALAQYVEDSSAHVQAGELWDFMNEHFRGKGATVGEVLQNYARECEGSLREMFDALDKSGAVDWFDWEEFADSGQEPVANLVFVVIPSDRIGPDTVFLFEDF